MASYRSLAALLLPLLLFLQDGARAQSVEWPGLFHQQCGACHDRAQDLLEQRAALQEGVLRGRESGRDIRAFIGDHFGRRTEADVTAVYAELLRVAQGGGRFQQQCAVCHVSAEMLAHDSLVLRDGELYGRYSGRRIADYLARHGRLAVQKDAAFFTDVLRRNLEAAR